MKNVYFFILAFMFFNYSYSQYTVTIKNMKYYNNTAIPTGQPINFGTNSSVTIKFDVQIDFGQVYIPSSTGTLRIYGKSGNNSPYNYVVLGVSLHETYTNPAWTQTLSSIQVTMLAEDYNTTGDYIYAEYTQSGGTTKRSSNWAIIKTAVVPTTPLQNYDICCAQTITIGESAATVIGEMPTGGNGIYRYFWYVGGPDGFEGTKNYNPGYLTESTGIIRETISGGLYGYSSRILITVNKCPVSNNITQTVNVSDSPSVRQASSYLTLVNTIQPSASASYHAENYVTLRSGFHAKNGSDTHVYLAGCTQERATSMENGEDILSLNRVAAFESKTFALSPNPAVTATLITSSESIKSVIVTSIDGKIMFNREVNSGLSYELDVSAYSRGYYTIMIATEKGSLHSGKLIKN